MGQWAECHLHTAGFRLAQFSTGFICLMMGDKRGPTRIGEGKSCGLVLVLCDPHAWMEIQSAAYDATR